jgi:hypothetical protein
MVKGYGKESTIEPFELGKISYYNSVASNAPIENA